MVKKGSGWHKEPKRHAEAVRKGLKTRFSKPKTTTKRPLKKQVVNKIPKGWKKFGVDKWQSSDKQQVVHIFLTKPFRKWQVYVDDETMSPSYSGKAYETSFESKEEARRKAIQFMKQLNDIAMFQRKTFR